MRTRLVRFPPAGSPIPRATIGAVWREPDPEGALRSGLMERLSSRWLSLHCSGREALRVAFRYFADRTGRGEIVVPAYTCYSIPAAAVAAGLRVRLVDVDLAGQIDPEALRKLPLERAAALVVGNLFGVPEPTASAIELAHRAGVHVVDDAAQSLGARSCEGPVGARGDVGLLSFGRGKPLSALAGGALAWRNPPEPVDDGLALEVSDDPKATAQRVGAMFRAVAYDLARLPGILRLLVAIPALHIGATVYDPGFRRGPMGGASVVLAAALLQKLDVMNRSRERVARAIAGRLVAETGFRALVARDDEFAIYPRMGVLAPRADARDAALRGLGWLGVTGMYPGPVDRIPALAAHLADAPVCLGAREFCARLITVPTHAGLRASHVEALISELRRLS